MTRPTREDPLSGGPDTALIVHPLFTTETAAPDHILADRIEEIEGLARAIGLDILDTQRVKIRRKNPARLIGSGACAALAEQIAALSPSVVIVDHALSPVQQRNLEKDWQTKVIDRTGLILEIFGERAQTKEGRIQVELAALEYQKSRLVRSWTHLERQRGGTGKTGGPGETQLEIDRRMIIDRIAHLKGDLEKVRKTRELGRKSRERVPYPIVALVGYTNAGKSTLFNKVTGAGVFAEDLLFATLDPTMRKMNLPGGRPVIISDTVGFIADLPTMLVAAFRATLEQVQYADVILHVRDVSRPDNAAQRAAVVRILHELGVDDETDSRMIEVWNKIDALTAEERVDILHRAAFKENAVALSARDGTGLDALLTEIEARLSRAHVQAIFTMPATDGAALAWLYRNGEVLDRQDKETRVRVTVSLDPAAQERFQNRFGYPQDVF